MLDPLTRFALRLAPLGALVLLVPATAVAGPAAGLALPLLVSVIAVAGLYIYFLQRRLGRLEAAAHAQPAVGSGFPDSAAQLLSLTPTTGHALEAFIDPSGRMVWLSPAITPCTGHSVEEVLAAADYVDVLIYERDRRYMRERTRLVLAGATTAEFETRFMTRDGVQRWMACHWHALRDEAGTVQGIRATADDIQTRKEAEYKLLETVAALRRAQALSEHYLRRSNEERSRLSALLDVVEEGILLMDLDHRVMYCNRALYDIWRVPPGDNLVGVRDLVLQQHSQALLEDPQACQQHIADVLRTHDTSEPFELRFRDGRIVTDFSRVVPGEGGGRPIGRIWVYEDVTERRRVATQLINMAERDPLTNLYNRRRFHEELERMLADGLRHSDEVGLLVLDLDGFKPVNDLYGHQAGDEVLVGLATAVAAVVRRNEMFFRMGGDEFAILVPAAAVEELVGLARRVCACISALNFSFGGVPVSVTASIGIGLSSGSGSNTERLIGAADRAMYAAKSLGGNCWEFAERGEA